MSWYQLGLKSLLRRKKKTFILFTAILLAVLIVAALTSAYQGMMEAVREGAMKYGVSYRLIPKENREPISYLGIPIVPSTTDSKPLSLSYSDYSRMKQENEAAVVGIGPRIVKRAKNKQTLQEFITVGIDMVEERKMKPWWRIWGSWPTQANELIIGYDIGTQFQLGAGDILTLEIDGNEKIFKVVGVLHYTGHVDDRLLFYPADLISETEIHFLEMVVSFDFDNNLVSPQGWEWKKQRSPLEEERFESIEQIAELSPYVITVTTILGALIVLITLINEVEERKQEFALLQAVGIPKKMLIKLLFFEITILSFCGSLLGVFLGIVTANVWLGLMSGLKFFAYITISQCFLLICFILTLTFVVSIYPALRVLKQEPITLLRHE